MQLAPHYGSNPLIVIGGSPDAIATPAIRQRERLATIVASLTDDQLRHDSRCAGWTVRDVIVHLESTNTFWTFSIEAGRRGEPTQFLSTFDPVATPAQLVDAAADLTTDEVRERFLGSSAAVTDLLGSLHHDEWSMLAEAPPGHLTISAVAHHALWDSWIHERDIVLPLGEAAAVEPDEVAACLAYVATLAPAFAISHGGSGAGRLAIEVTDPDLSIVAEIGARVEVEARSGEVEPDLCLTGDAVTLVEALSIRRPLDQPIAAASAWMIEGLSTIFETESA